VRRRKDGSLIDISLTVSPIRDNAGRIVAASKIARDITEQKRAEAALRTPPERSPTTTKPRSSLPAGARPLAATNGA
jgi:hypothetical protein